MTTLKAKKQARKERKKESIILLVNFKTTPWKITEVRKQQ